ncbi:MULTISPECIES: helix-turn-helix transcriptional regulator [unclassified Variovorax]|uniref:helix-turn-helix transcriptional regulator n=1 Tax=unclassified Variovorax TaxID=663243 RepID=UPI003F478574
MPFDLPALAPKDFSRLSADARTLTSPAFRERLLDELQNRFGCTHVAINTVHLSGHVSSFSRGFVEEKMGDAWVETAGPEQDLLSRRMLAQPGRSVIVDWSDAELQSPAATPARAFMQRFGIHHALGIALQIQGAQGLTLISMCRRALAQPFGDADAALLDGAAGYWMEALMVNRLRVNLAQSTRDSTETPMALATPDGWLIYPNAAFMTAWAAMAAIDGGPQMPRVPEAWLAGKAEPDSILSAQGWTLRSTSVEDGLRIELRRPEVPSALATLTEREHQVAKLYGHGHSHKEVGRTLSLAPNTVRAHLGRIFDKLAIRSRAQLRQMLPFSDSSFL